MTVLGPLVGLALVVVALVDLAWRTVAAGSGAGPATSRLAGATWHAALTVHRRRPSHRFLAAAGVGIPTVDDEQYVTATTATRARRHLLAGTLLDDGCELPTTVKESEA